MNTRHLTPRHVQCKGAFCWCRLPTSGDRVTYRLVRRSMAGRVFAISVSFEHRQPRRGIAAGLQSARRDLRERVDEADLEYLGVTA